MDQNINTGELSLRRLRKNHLTRELVQEIQLSEKNFIQPYFVVDGIENPQPIAGLTDNYRETSESILNKMQTKLFKKIWWIPLVSKVFNCLECWLNLYEIDIVFSRRSKNEEDLL